MAVVIDSGPVTATLKLHEVPSERWRDLMRVRRDYLNIKLSHDCRCLVEFIDDAKKMYKVCGFKSVDDMVANGYELSPADVRVALDWLKLHPPKEAVSFETAIRLGNHGTNQHTRGPDNIRSSDYGTSPAYIQARLDRDGHTELANAVRTKAMSARQAGIRAGFIRPPTPYEQIIKALDKLCDDEGKKLLQECQKRWGHQ
jgi:hypothetical protein